MSRPKSTSKSKSKSESKPAGAGDISAFSIAGDPRAKRSVRQIKAWGGLIGFGLALMLSVKAGLPTVMAAERALIAGVAGYLVAWACAVAVWRALLMAELRARAEALKSARETAPAAK